MKALRPQNMRHIDDRYFPEGIPSDEIEFKSYYTDLDGKDFTIEYSRAQVTKMMQFSIWWQPYIPLIIMN